MWGGLLRGTAARTLPQVDSRALTPGDLSAEVLGRPEALESDWFPIW